MSDRNDDFNTDDKQMQNPYDAHEKPEQEYIDEMVEYQENQFNPGYYVGTGKIPPSVKASGNAMPVAIWMFIQAVGLMLFYGFIIKLLFLNKSDSHFTVSFSIGSPLLNFIIITLFFVIAIFICIWFGIIYLKKAKHYRLQEKQLEESTPAPDKYQEDHIMQRLCPECGKKHDIDYPKCPYCNHSYIS